MEWNGMGWDELNCVSAYANFFFFFSFYCMNDYLQDLCFV
jgi:hypothetical protein